MGFDLRRFHPERPPAVLLGGLNLVRAAGLGGIPVVVASPEPDWPAFSSRFAHGTLLLPPLERREEVAKTLLAAGERLYETLGRPVPLFYGNDDYLSLVEEYREPLGRWYAITHNAPHVARALLDKQRFEDFALALGLPVPRTLRWEELERWYAPVLVKPKVKTGYDDSPIYRRLFGGAGKARIFASGPELAALPLAQQLRDSLMIQEYVRGGDRQLWSFHGYADEKGELLACFSGRKIRTHPPLTGESSCVELVHDEAFAFVGRHVAARVPLCGVFKIDFKRDEVTGAWLLLEINARFNLWHYLGAHNGINLLRVAYDYLVYGERPKWLESYRTTHRWVSLRADWRAYRALSRRGELTAWTWLRSLLGATNVYDTFSWRDPAPFIRHFVNGWRTRIPRLTKRWLSTAS